MVPKNKKSSYVDEAMWRFVHVHCAHRWKTVGQASISPNTHPFFMGKILKLTPPGFFFKYQLKFVLS